MKEPIRYSDFSSNQLKWLWTILAIALLGTLIAELLIHPHPHFDIEGTPFFNAWYGFLCCAGIVIFSNLLGKILKRKENYYREDTHD